MPAAHVHLRYATWAHWSGPCIILYMYLCIYMCTYLTLCVNDGSADSDGKPGRARANPFCECCTVLSTSLINI